jgi:predicted acetylornithine/succinylornithine family transaminase
MEKKLIEEADRYLMQTYNRYPIVIRKGRGIKVWDRSNREYYDFLGGIAVNCLGHCHPRVVIALQKQAQRLLHVSNLYHTEPQIKLAKRLVELSCADRVFFCNSGAEAVEGAIKLARKYAREHVSPERFEIITAYGSFHGRTLAALTATGQEKLQKGFEPLVPGFRHVTFDDIESLKEAINNNTCAVMLEPVQGEGGIRVPSENYLKEVREICDSHRLLLILDEVQTGMGRTGKVFAYEHFGIEPDIFTLAKGLGGGVPIGAVLAKERIAAAFGHGSHASTFGGNPLACTAALSTIETLLEDGFVMENCRRMGDYFRQRLERLKSEFPSLIVEVRGLGLMLGVEMTKACSPIVEECMNRGVLINCTSGNVLRFTPPLIVKKQDIDHLIDILEDVLEKESH